jgi:phosphate:Na+ symporter
MSWIEVGVAVAAAVVLFLFGIEHFSSEIQAVTGTRFRKSLARGTSNRFVGFGLGAAVTAVIQSSTATSVICVGLVNAGVLSFRQALPVLFGANVGTTVTAQLVALKLTDFAPWLILAGFLAGLLPARAKVFGRSIFYFGLVFFSLQLVSAAVEPLKTEPALLNILAGLDSPLVGILAGAVFTTLVQSSSVTTGVAIVLMSQDALSLSAAIPIILGANIGTTSTSLVAAARLDTSARRTAVSHALYNLLGVLCFVPLLPLAAPTLSRLGLEGAAALAAAHLIFNALMAGLFLAALTPFARLVERLVPDEAGEEPPIPRLALADLRERDHRDDAVLAWAAHVLRTQSRCYTASVLAIETRDGGIDSRARRAGALVEYALEEASFLVRELATGEVSEAQSESILRFVVTIDHLRQLQDSLADLRAISERLERHHARLSIDAILEIQAVFPHYSKYLERLAALLAAPDRAGLPALERSHREAELRVKESYQRFLELVRELDDAAELADFLSIHQRLRTKLEAFVGYLQGGGAVSAPRPLREPGTPAADQSGGAVV